MPRAPTGRSVGVLRRRRKNYILRQPVEPLHRPPQHPVVSASPDAGDTLLLLLLWCGRLGQPTSVLLVLEGLENLALCKVDEPDLGDDQIATTAERTALQSPLRRARNTQGARLAEAELGNARLAATCAAASPHHT